MHCDYQRREADDHDSATPVTRKMHPRVSRGAEDDDDGEEDDGPGCGLSQSSLAPLLGRDGGERHRAGSRAGSSSGASRDM